MPKSDDENGDGFVIPYEGRTETKLEQPWIGNGIKEREKEVDPKIRGKEQSSMKGEQLATNGMR